MSLVRNSSKKKFSIAPEDLAACLDQKNSMIAVLQAEVEDLRFNHEKYERMQEQVCRTKEKYQSCLRDYQINKVSNLERLDLTAKNCLELKIQVDHLSKQLQIKTQQLKDAKAQTQQLVQHNGRRQDEAGECQVKGQQLRAANELLKMEEERTKSQIILAREELERQRKQNSNINKSVETIKDKCYKTQSYIRNLVREESTLNESLAKIEDQNNYLDGHITQLNTVHAMVTAEVSQAQKQVQDQKFAIASKQLELKRIQKEFKEAVKNLALEKDKSKVLNDQVEQRKFNLSRMENEVRECSDEINYILAKNNEVTEVNSQLRNDFKVCERHLENVIRLNKSIEAELNKWKEVNQVAVRKLQEPMKDMSNNFVSKATPRKWTQTSRMTATGGFQNHV